ncbi:hypothetical protein BDR26DRAFT_858803 [Obelidium mucronatum]|nr:hypothetical protein BDR26DRAFT_858803 [Obelidium mucronatum]
MAAALCSMAEIYMTDCCDEPDAERQCTAFTEQAIELDPSSPEAFQTRASVLLSKCDPTAATTAILTSLSLWSLTDFNTWPSYQTRLATAKILMEVDKDDDAAAVLETVLKENDDDLEVWYLFSWCYYRMGNNGSCNNVDADADAEGDCNVMTDSVVSIEDKVEAFLDAKECLEKLLELSAKMDPEEVDPAMLQHVHEMLQEVSQVVAQHPQIVQQIEDAHARGDPSMFQDVDDNDDMEM